MEEIQTNVRKKKYSLKNVGLRPEKKCDAESDRIIFMQLQKCRTCHRITNLEIHYEK